MEQKHAGGRPKKHIDPKTFENLCALQCTEEEICFFLDVSDKTLSGWCKRTYGGSFSEVYKQKRSVGKMSLRRMQWKLAEKNPTMAIWLGKQYLGQREPERDINGRIEIAQPIDDTIKEMEAYFAKQKSST